MSRQSRKRLYYKRKSKGLCVNCGRIKKTKNVSCNKCEKNTGKYRKCFRCKKECWGKYCRECFLKKGSNLTTSKSVKRYYEKR